MPTKTTKPQRAIFSLGCLLILFGLGAAWLPLGMIAAGAMLITIAVILVIISDDAKSEQHDDRPDGKACDHETD